MRKICAVSVSCILCEHYIPREAKWGQIPTGSAHANDLFCNIESLLDLALASVVQDVDFDNMTEIGYTPDQSQSVKLLDDTAKAAAVLWSSRNYDAAIAGFTKALSKGYAMESDPASDIVEVRLYRQLVRLTHPICKRVLMLSATPF